MLIQPPYRIISLSEKGRSAPQREQIQPPPVSERRSWRSHPITEYELSQYLLSVIRLSGKMSSVTMRIGIAADTTNHRLSRLGYPI